MSRIGHLRASRRPPRKRQTAGCMAEFIGVYDNEDGLALGRALGQHVFATQLRPIPEPGTWVLLVFGLVGCLAGRRLRRNSGNLGGPLVSTYGDAWISLLREYLPGRLQR